MSSAPSCGPRRAPRPLAACLPHGSPAPVRLALGSSPVQLIHGTQDEVIPFSNGLDLHTASKGFHPLEPAWVEGATHNNLETMHSDTFLTTLKAFFAHLLATPAAEVPETPPENGWFSGIGRRISEFRPSRSCGL